MKKIVLSAMVGLSMLSLVGCSSKSSLIVSEDGSTKKYVKVFLNDENKEEIEFSDIMTLKRHNYEGTDFYYIDLKDKDFVQKVIDFDKIENNSLELSSDNSFKKLFESIDEKENVFSIVSNGDNKQILPKNLCGFKTDVKSSNSISENKEPEITLEYSSYSNKEKIENDLSNLYLIENQCNTVKIKCEK